VYPGDDDPAARHYAAMIEDVIVGIASVVPETLDAEGVGGSGSFRLRGMATVPDVRGWGIGTALVERVIGYTADQGGDLVWCKARIGAAAFYRGRGFRQVGEPFELPDIGPHVVMLRSVTAADGARR